MVFAVPFDQVGRGCLTNVYFFSNAMSISNFAGNVQQSGSFALVPLVLVPMSVDELKQVLFELRHGQLIFIDKLKYVQELKEQILHLEMLNRTKDERIQELECLQNPYSNDGDAICNFDF